MEDPNRRVPVSDDELLSTTRRGILAAGGAVALGGAAGCLGRGGSPDTDDTGLEKPWTTEALLTKLDENPSLTIYASTGDDQQWYDLVEVINDEFDTNIQADVFASYGSKVTQRFVQEHQADNHKADVLSTPSGLDERMRMKAEKADRETALDIGRKYFEWDLHRNYWFTDVLTDVQKTPFYISAYNTGPGLALPINEETFDERGLPYPETYNDLFDDRFEGMSMAISKRYVSTEQSGWIARVHAEKSGMDPVEWSEKLWDHLEFTGVSSHTAGARAVRDGDADMMLYNWPLVLDPFMGPDSPLRGVFPEDVKSFMAGDPVCINRHAPNTWAARFFVSAMLEESVQRRLINEVTDQIPVRLDLDYAENDPDPYTHKRLNVDFNPVTFWESWDNVETGKKLADAGCFRF